MSDVSQQDYISLELAIATIVNADVNKISEVLKQVPPEKTAKITIPLRDCCRNALGQVWQESD